MKHKNDTITILLHVNVSKQVESKLEIQEAPLTCTELNAEALGSSVCGKLVCMSVIITVILNSSKGVGRGAETEVQLIDWSYQKLTSPLYSLLSVTCSLPCHMAVRLIA